MSASLNLNNGIVIIGSGNVATHLSQALMRNGFLIRTVFSKTLISAKELGNKLNVKFTNDLKEIPQNADLYIIAVKDESINDIAKELHVETGIVVHTAGSISLGVLEKYFTNCGVLYPLQTFSKTRDLEFASVPMCIESNKKVILNKLNALSNIISEKVYEINSEKRKSLHLAAVFACNFANHMFAIATDILNQSDLSFELLMPLIQETADKAIDSDPIKAQTGPAVRNDLNVIASHLELLKEEKEFEKIYRFVSESIYKLNIEKNK